MCTHYGGWGGYLTFAPRRWNNWHNEMEVLAKVDTFLKKVLALYLSQEQKMCLHWQKIHFIHKTHISLTCFPFRQALQDECVLTRNKKDKGLETPQVLSPNYRNWYFFYYYLAIHLFRLNYSSGTFLFEDCRCEVERWLACVISTAWITQEKLWKRSQYLRATDFC